MHLISPNLHVIMVHFPLGIFVFGLFLEVFGLVFWRRSSARVAARWMILFGALLAIPANFSGIDALKDVVERTRGEGLTDQQWALLRKHLQLTSIGTGIAVVSVVIGMGLSDLWRKRLYVLLLLALIAAAGLMTFGSHFGGEGIYLQGIAVKLKGKPMEGFEYYVPARSTHILVSGLAVALGLGALGASLRRLSTHIVPAPQPEPERELEAFESGGATIYTPPAPPRRVTDDLTVARTLNADAALPPAREPASRFWLLTTVLALIAFGLGVWFMMQEESFLDTHRPTPGAIAGEVWQTALATSKEPGKGTMQNRRGAHILLGALLVVLPLILAAGVRWGPRHKFVIGVLCLLIVFVIAAQIWMGVLLTHDASEGPLLHFSPATDNAASADTGK